MTKRVELQAVWGDSDLRTLLENLGIIERLLTGELTCSVCGKTVDFDNLGAILPQADSAQVVCDCAHCIRAVTISGQTTSVG
jgi:hypothetical protein